MKNNTQDPLLFQFFNEVGIIEQLVRTNFESALPDGLKMSQFVVLNHLLRLDGEFSPNRLANALQVTKGAITNTLQRLESRGLVRINADPSDGRGKLVNLTAAGRKVREQCIRNISPLIADLNANFGEARFLKALPLLEEVRKYLDQRRS